MGLLDGILSAALGGSHAPAPGAAAPSAGGINSDALLQIASQLIQQHGGIAGLVNSFGKAGLGQVVSSWVGTGQNQAISPNQVTQVLGDGQIGQIASQLGLNSGQASGILAQLLPHVVDHMTPGGQVPAGDHSSQGDLLTAALGMLRSKL